VTGVDLDGNPVEVSGHGFLARCLQHESDHLDGTIYVERLVGRHSRAARKALKQHGWGEPGLSWDPSTLTADEA
jgi:peptide deformylase